MSNLKYQEALKFFRVLPHRIPLRFANDEFCKKYDKNFALIKELVDKATPKKIIYEDIGYDHYKNVNVYGCICPSCGLHIIEFTDDDVSTDSDDIETMFNSSMVHHGHQGLNNFCNRCSQAFDWSDEDDR